jgi:hypothetical protein
VVEGHTVAAVIIRRSEAESRFAQVEAEYRRKIDELLCATPRRKRDAGGLSRMELALVELEIEVERLNHSNFSEEDIGIVVLKATLLYSYQAAQDVDEGIEPCKSRSSGGIKYGLHLHTLLFPDKARPPLPAQPPFLLGPTVRAVRKRLQQLTEASGWYSSPMRHLPNRHRG